MLIPLRGNFATLRVTNFSAVIPSCFLFCYLWVLLFFTLLPLGTIVLVLLQ
jgi:hypothetical protein